MLGGLKCTTIKILATCVVVKVYVRSHLWPIVEVVHVSFSKLLTCLYLEVSIACTHVHDTFAWASCLSSGLFHDVFRNVLHW